LPRRQHAALARDNVDGSITLDAKNRPQRFQKRRGKTADFLGRKHSRLCLDADSVVPLDFVELVSVGAAVKPVICPSSRDDYVSVRHPATHTLAVEIRATEGLDMRKYFFDFEEAKKHLRVPAPPRQNEENVVSNLRPRAKIVPTDAPRWRRGPKVRIVINPRSLLAADRAIHRLKRAGDVDITLHCYLW